MINYILLFSSLIALIAGIVSQNMFYRISAFITAFSLLTILTTKDLTTAFIIMINGFVIYVLLFLSYKEYKKDDN
ncbi:MAG: hypothetical protein WCQ53_00310 [bacterium]